MKKILALLLALVMVFALAACGDEPAPGGESDAPQQGGDNVIKIGVFEPLTGASGAGGKQEMLGMQYAHSLKPTVMIGDVEYTIELVPEQHALLDEALGAYADFLQLDFARMFTHFTDHVRALELADTLSNILDDRLDNEIRTRCRQSAREARPL